MIETNNVAAMESEDAQDLYWIKRDIEGPYRIMSRQGSNVRPMTNRWLHHLQIGGAHHRPRDFSDDAVRSLRMKLYQNGTKSFRACFKNLKGDNVSIQLGHFPAVTVEFARGMAVIINSLVAAGIDPQSHLQEMKLIPKSRTKK